MEHQTWPRSPSVAEQLFKTVPDTTPVMTTPQNGPTELQQIFARLADPTPLESRRAA